MIICAAGDIHGAIDRLYEDVLAFEESLGARFAWVLHVGDFGIWPDPTRIDGATKRHDGAGDFPVWWSEQRTVPRRTLFIKGNHEDFVWLDEQPEAEVLPGLFYLRNGLRFDITEGKEILTVGGLGGCFGPSDYQRISRDLQRHRKRHYTRDEIDALVSGGRVDVLLVHDAPTGVVFERHRRGAGWASESEGLDDLILGVRPQVCLFGHHHTRLDAAIDGIPCMGMNKSPHPGSLVAIDIRNRREGMQIIGEWPRKAEQPT